MRLIGITLNVPFSGSITIVASVATIWFLLRRRTESFSTLGFFTPSGLLKTIVLNVLVVVSIALVFNSVLQSLFDWMGIAPASHDTFDYLKGNLMALALTLVVVAWGTAAFGEEIVFRGFILNRLHECLGSKKGTLLIAIIIHAVLFGLAHWPHGLRGIISTGVIALMLGSANVIGNWQQEFVGSDSGSRNC